MWRVEHGRCGLTSWRFGWRVFEAFGASRKSKRAHVADGEYPVMGELDAKSRGELLEMFASMGHGRQHAHIMLGNSTLVARNPETLQIAARSDTPHGQPLAVEPQVHRDSGCSRKIALDKIPQNL